MKFLIPLRLDDFKNLLIPPRALFFLLKKGAFIQIVDAKKCLKHYKNTAHATKQVNWIQTLFVTMFQTLKYYSITFSQCSEYAFIFNLFGTPSSHYKLYYYYYLHALTWLRGRRFILLCYRL